MVVHATVETGVEWVTGGGGHRGEMAFFGAFCISWLEKASFRVQFADE